ncbi:MAG: hypothetical protein ABIK28_02745 [Planctomycetota bacterium]
MSTIIKFWTRKKFFGPPAKFSHVEYYDSEKAKSFSADGYHNIVGWRDVQYSHPQWWVALEIPADELTSPDMARLLADNIASKSEGYDYLGAFTCRWDGRQDSKKWFCSEAVARCLGFRSRPTPQKLYDRLVKIGCKRVGFI